MNRYRMMGLVLALSVVCLTGTVRADVVNGDFSSGVDGWQTQGAWVADNSSPDGASIKGTGYAWLYQPGITSLALVEGQTYQLSFLGKLLADDGVASDAIVNAVVGIDTPGAGSYAITPTLTATWQQYNITFTATAADANQPYTVAFLNSYGKMTGQPGATGMSTMGIDNVHLSAIPEPATIVLFGTGLLGLLAYAWRKRK